MKCVNKGTNKFAIIDLGSNTFHLLIAEVNTLGHVKILYKERIYVKLAIDGITFISDPPYKRGLEALIHFKKIIDQNGVIACRAIGTAALRIASNASDFINDVYLQTGITIEVVSGEEEAELIFQGVKATLPKNINNYLIMDIGGGSVEFIISDSNSIKWKSSFAAGVAVLKSNFHFEDPISIKEIKTIEAFLDNIFQPLSSYLDQFQPQVFVGASGTFEVLEMALGGKGIDLHTNSVLDIDCYFPVYDQVIHSTLEEIGQIKYIPPERRELIQVAFILINWILKKRTFTQYRVSRYALKEGAILRLAGMSN